MEVTRALCSRLDHEHPSTIAEVTDAALSVSRNSLSTPAWLRSLALRLAAATLIDADMMVVYDSRLATAAGETGLRVVAPR